MNESNHVRRTLQRALSVRGALALSVLPLSLSVSAQGGQLIVSTSSDISAAVGVPFSVQDGDLAVVEGGGPVSPFLAGGHFLGTIGFRPSDIDAFSHLPNSTPGRGTGFVFSMVSNEGGFLDGDLLALANGGSGVSLIVSELDLATAMGAGGVNIDVDAVTYDDEGRILFSLASDVTGTSLGLVEDGDILRLEASFAGVTRVLSESEVQARFTQATGLSDAILDVQALEWAGGAIWVAVQSPSRHDGSILAMNGIPAVVVDENDLGLGGAEIDALDEPRPGDLIPVCHLSTEEALPGDFLHIETRGGPGQALLVLMAGGTGYINFARNPGFGGWYLDRFDPWLNARLTTVGFPIVLLDGAGQFSADWPLPPGMEFGVGFAGELGWSFQLMELGSRELSAPFRVQRL